MDELLLRWTPAEAASRALQAVHGYVCFTTVGAEKGVPQSFTEDTLAWLERVPTLSESESIEIVQKNREAFDVVAASARMPFFSADSRRLWRLFMERYDFYVSKLRANAEELLECFDLEQLSKLFGQPASYFRRLPPSSELVIGLWMRGLRADLVIPPRLLVLDMVLMLVHARDEHARLEQAVFIEAGVVRFTASGRLDSYTRQTLILATSVLDNVLTDYGNAVVAALQSIGVAADAIANARALQEKGVTARLQAAPNLWRECLRRPRSGSTDVVRDMLILVEIRNRLVHPDGRVNCWYAFQLDHTRTAGWHFSPRIQSYLDERVRYRIPQSNTGYELALAQFCVDTVILTIDHLHNILFPEESRASWLNLPRAAGDVLDLDWAVQNEHVLQL
jgi:hypothetical protein